MTCVEMDRFRTGWRLAVKTDNPQLGTIGLAGNLSMLECTWELAVLEQSSICRNTENTLVYGQVVCSSRII